ncbi:MAG: fibronectin type III domain-containing protein [Candidatus Shapirobacteria bacterium]|nr:fibronectin type III domain-containing protein [Candidatus Shapirobacteria bacterium]
MKKLNIKTIVIFVVLAVVMVLLVVGVTQIRTFMSGAAGGVEPAGVSAVPGNDGKTAVITWTSDKESIGKVEYGATAASLVLMSAETAETTSHNVSLTSLRSDTTYYYRIRVGDEVFDNGGIPYSFKTKSDASAVAPAAVPTVSTTPGTASTGSATTCDSKTDYNKDGSINSLDLAACKKSGGKISPGSATVVTPVVTKSTAKPGSASTPVVDCTKTIPDYNSDGIINGLDRVNCLKSRR